MNENKKVLVRQGDVVLKGVEDMPDGLKEKDKILAYGEITGHKHCFIDSAAKVFAEKTGQQYAVLEQECELQHEEHGNMSIPKGVYKVVVQKEYDIVEGVRQVLD